MKFGISPEYIIMLGAPYGTITGATVNTVSGTLGSANSYVAGLFIAPYDMQVNRLAFVVTSTGSQVITGGMTTVNASGNPNGDGGALTFINSGTTSTLTANTYAQITFANTTLTAGTEYFMAAQTTTFTSSVSVMSTMNNVTFPGLCEYPYNVIRSAGTTTKATGISTICCGYNDGTTTQWYGIPVVVNSQNQALNTSGTAVASTGCKFRIPSNFVYFKVSAVGVTAAKAAGHSLTLQILESDNSTQVTNATSVINANWAGGTANGIYLFYFDAYVTLRSHTTYYIKISAAGTAATGTNIQYHRINGTGLTTSTPANAEFMNAYDIINNFSTTSTGAVYTEYDNARLSCFLICETEADSYRGTKENSYSGY